MVIRRSVALDCYRPSSYPLTADYIYIKRLRCRLRLFMGYKDSNDMYKRLYIVMFLSSVQLFTNATFSSYLKFQVAVTLEQISNCPISNSTSNLKANGVLKLQEKRQ